MTMNETLAKYANTPIGDSIVPVTQALAGASVLVAIQEPPSSESGKLGLKVSTDKQGRSWAYLYTDENEFSSAFPEGGSFAEMAFVDAFKIVTAEERFGGIFINHNPELMYVIPKEAFAQVIKTLAE